MLGHQVSCRYGSCCSHLLCVLFLRHRFNLCLWGCSNCASPIEQKNGLQVARRCEMPC